jgi:molecular chaperone GrpE
MSDEKDKDQQAKLAEELAETAVLSEDFAVDASAEAGVEDSVEEALAKAEAAAEENWAKYLRTVAELDNVRKRAARDVEKARQFGVEGLAAELLSVADSLEMALETGSEAPAESLLEGGRATLKQLQAAMEKYGVTQVSPEGEPFDPELHEAMTMAESTTAEPNSVISVVQRGYQLNGRLLRPARVIVAKEPVGKG